MKQLLLTKENIETLISKKCLENGCKTDNTTFERKLQNGRTNVVLLNGYWVWWCITHDRPLYQCFKEQLIQELMETNNKSQNNDI